MDLASGRVATALDAYQGAERLHVADTRAAARAALLDHHRADHTASPSGSQLVLSYRNDEVRQLDVEIRGAPRDPAGAAAPNSVTARPLGGP